MRTKSLMGLLWPALLAAIFPAGCGGPEGRSGGGDGPSKGPGEPVEVSGGEALVWGEGDQAERLAGNGVAALAVEDTSARSVAGAAGYLKEERGVRVVTLIGASAGTAGVLGAAEGDPGLAEEVRRMAERAPGSRNEALILPGEAQAIFETDQGERLMRTILERPRDSR